MYIYIYIYTYIYIHMYIYIYIPPCARRDDCSHCMMIYPHAQVMKEQKSLHVFIRAGRWNGPDGLVAKDRPSDAGGLGFESHWAGCG